MFKIFKKGKIRNNNINKNTDFLVLSKFGPPALLTALN